LSLLAAGEFSSIMPRSLWNGTIAFGVVRVPVKLYSAVESKAIKFRERHVSDGAAIEHRRICAQEEREVPYAEIVKGFPVGPDSYVVLSGEELRAADGASSHVIEIEHFVRAREIDPIYYDSVYYLGPTEVVQAPYRLLQAALKRSDRVGIGHFVFHGKDQLGAIRALDEILVMHTMRFADELAPASKPSAQAPARSPAKREIDAARSLVEQLGDRFQPARYSDSYRQAVLDLIERKARGEAIEMPAAEPATPDEELLKMLQASLKDRGGARSRSSTGNGSATAKRRGGRRGEPSRRGGGR
jgi:DNA end-binding protein Ku